MRFHAGAGGEAGDLVDCAGGFRAGGAMIDCGGGLIKKVSTAPMIEP